MVPVWETQKVMFQVPSALMGVPVAQLVKNLPVMQDTYVQSLGWENSWRRERLPTLVLWPGQFHGLYSPWDHKESDTTEQLSLQRQSHVTLPTKLELVSIFSELCPCLAPHMLWILSDLTCWWSLQHCLHSSIMIIHSESIPPPPPDHEIEWN